MQLPSRLRSGSWASQGYSSCPVSLESATSGEGRLHWPTKKSLNSSAQKAAGSSNPKLRHLSLAAVGTKTSSSHFSEASSSHFSVWVPRSL